MKSKDRPYMLYVAEKIYLEISRIKENNIDYTNSDAIKNFIKTKFFEKLSSGKFHDEWLEKLRNNDFIDQNNKKIPVETIKLLHVQKDMMIKQLIQFPDLYYTKNKFPLKISQRAFDQLWRICESYELWCKETEQSELLKLNIID